MKHMFILAAAIATPMLAMPAATAQMRSGPADPTPTMAAPYVMKAGASDLYEIQSSQLALTKTRNPQVRSLANMLIQHHRMTTRDVTAAARRAGLRPRPPMLEPHQRAMIAELRRARAAGKRVVFDPNIRPRLWDDMDRMRATVTEGARAATLVMPSLDDETTHFGDASLEATIARYAALGVAEQVVKDGGEGATLVFGEKRSHVPSARVEKIVDTTSAGDSFNGAFLARLAAGAAPQEAARFAADVAAAVIQHHGALVVKDKLPLS